LGEIMNIGFIGIGQMGYPMSINLLKCGHNVIAYNRTIEKAEKLKEFGAYVEKSPKDVAEKSEIIIIMVSNNEAVNDVLFGKDGISYSKNKILIIDMSTISPIFSMNVAEKMKSLGFRYIDAPVIGSVPHAERRELNIVVGGDIKDFNDALEILKCLGKNIFYMGKNGYGLIMKMVNNIILGGTMEIISEAFNLGESFGLTRDTMYSVVSSGSAGSKILDFKKENIINDYYEPFFKLSHITKDLRYAIDLSNSRNITLPATSVIHEMYKVSMVKGLGEKDISSIYLTIKDLND